MTTELTLLALCVGLGFVHIVAASHAASLQRGYRWSASARDEPTEPLHGVAGRLDRALRNLPGNLSAVCRGCSRGPCLEPTQRTHRMGRPALFLGPRRLPSALCGGHPAGALARMERRSARHPAIPRCSPSGLRRMRVRAAAQEGAAAAAEGEAPSTEAERPPRAEDQAFAIDFQCLSRSAISCARCRSSRPSRMLRSSGSARQ